jgi:hypothetical protein
MRVRTELGPFCEELGTVPTNARMRSPSKPNAPRFWGRSPTEVCQAVVLENAPVLGFVELAFGARIVRALPRNSVALATDLGTADADPNPIYATHIAIDEITVEDER